jgi:4-hydroxybenzoate polyprenyltransferase
MEQASRMILADDGTDLPLCVDLDRTLIKTNILHESFVSQLKQNPVILLSLPIWLCRGKDYTKQKLIGGLDPSAASLPYNHEILEYLRAERLRGRKLYLTTDSNPEPAGRISLHLGIFEGVIACDGSPSRSGADRAKALEERFGKQGFDYVGHHSKTRAIWDSAETVAVVTPNRGMRGKQVHHARVTRTFPFKRFDLRVYARSMRLYQWVKNLLLFVPLVMAHAMNDATALFKVCLGFLAFSCCASTVYLINDLCDLEADRQHPTKKNRPLASGDMPLLHALTLIPFLVASSVLLSSKLALGFQAVLATYFCCTLAYSLWIKQVMLLDIILLALLYTVRILAGGYAATVPVSQWLLAFSMFFFLSLACIKRYAELLRLKRSNQNGARGRGYYSSDLEQIAIFGSTSGYISILVLALFINSKDISALYSNPELLWLICPLLLYWISRVWLLAHRGELNEDPILFAISDKVSYFVGLLAALLMVAATIPLR